VIEDTSFLGYKNATQARAR